MSEITATAALVILVALAFDFVNGFHDAANSIATIVATRVLTPHQAVLWATFFNVFALFVFGTGVAKTVGSGMISLDTVTPAVILSGLIGAVSWGLVTWCFGIPTSSSHALLGGYAGAAMYNSYCEYGLSAIYQPLIMDSWIKTLIFIVFAPVIGFLLAHSLVKAILFIKKRYSSHYPPKLFNGLQLVSSAFLSLMHGGNDAQKSAGLITGTLVSCGLLTHFEVPSWVIWISYGTMGLGTYFGGWRIVETMGRRLTRLKPEGGFCAETSAALAIMIATVFKLPLSTTHATTGAILGVGAARSLGAVRWNLAVNILWAWVLTIPLAALMGAIILASINLTAKVFI